MWAGVGRYADQGMWFLGKSGCLSWSEGEKGQIFRGRRVGLGSRGERQRLVLWEQKTFGSMGPAQALSSSKALVFAQMKW